MKNEYLPIGRISYTLHKHYCFMYNEVTIPKVTVTVLDIKFPLTIRLCLN